MLYYSLLPLIYSSHMDLILVMWLSLVLKIIKVYHYSLPHSRDCSNVLDALQSGALTGGRLAITTLLNLLVFVAILAFLNAAFAYLGERVGYLDLDFQVSYTRKAV